MNDEARAAAARLPAPHALPTEAVLQALHASPHGLEPEEAATRLAEHGPNVLPRAEPPGLLRVFLRQFLSPLIYILLIAAAVSVLLQEWSDAGFIFAVLLINAVIGTAQEHSAERAAGALQELMTTTVRVLRGGEAYEVDSRELVPGDVVLLAPGDRVAADARLLSASGLEVDESLLTGESLPVPKDAAARLGADTELSDRTNMGFAGTLVTAGHARGVVTATGRRTELGDIAEAVLHGPAAKPPLLLRMERFTRRIAILVLGAVVVMAVVSALRDTPLTEIFFVSVALAVSAIPEGLPVALTIALAVGMRRMARRNVIIRRLLAVEALGSCTFIASDKTGTLTVNEITVRRIAFPGQAEPWTVGGEGLAPEGAILTPRGTPAVAESGLLQRLCRAAVLTNEGFVGHRDGGWVHHGDPVDVALLVMAGKAGVTQPETAGACPELAAIPYESERAYSASLNEVEGGRWAFVKGAAERLLPMCDHMATAEGDRILDPDAVLARVRALADQGYRVLAMAAGPVETGSAESFSEDDLRGLVLLGLTGMIDPLRPEVKASVAACRRAGIEVSIVTGDHPLTALAIGRDLGFASDPAQVVTGAELREAAERGEAALDGLTRGARVFARVAPQQKRDIVESLQRQGHFVAVTGDGANDAPALRTAHVGVAMGRRGTDVAKETADIILTDDHFASIVAGVEEGRIAYGNVRKVIFLLISTGAAEIVLFTLSLIAGLPLPLHAVQLLWLNLVTNGIQHVGLAFEPAEGDELLRRPRPPREPIFNRIMSERVVLSGLVIGGLAFAAFDWMLAQGWEADRARNVTLLLMVLFENVQVFNARSETRFALAHNPMRNPLLLFGTLGAQLVHIGALYTPGLSGVLRAGPVSAETWLTLLPIALSLLVVMELHKLVLRLGGRSTPAAA